VTYGDVNVTLNVTVEGQQSPGDIREAVANAMGDVLFEQLLGAASS
jgi:hypothetical protein